MKTFMMYRREDISETHDENQVNPPEEPQFQGIEFDNGKVAICWLTPKSSVSVWDSMDDMLAVHGHPEYGSELVWTPNERFQEENARLAQYLLDLTEENDKLKDAYARLVERLRRATPGSLYAVTEADLKERKV